MMKNKGFSLGCGRNATCERESGFSLIELLVVMGIIGVLVSISIFSIQGVRESSRDTRRKADLESVRQAVEFYRSDCNQYPANPEISFGSALTGASATGPCANTNTYISKLPEDPETPTKNYYYNRVSTYDYVLCAALEGGGDEAAASSAGCGSCGGVACNYFVTP